MLNLYFICFVIFFKVPLGLDDDGLPLGIQVVSAPYNDRLCIAVAKHLEENFNGFVPPCNIIS